jgi:hypothetical protein
VAEIKFNSSIVVNKGQDIEVQVWLAKDLKKQINIQTYAGSGGENYKNVKNHHNDIFEVKQSFQSGNQTTLDKGQIAGLLYQLV